MSVPWRAWYDDGSVYDSAHHRWDDVPDDGFLVKILYYQNDGKQIQHGMEWCFEAPGRSGDVVQATGNDRDDILSRYPGAVMKRGRWAPDDFYKKVVAEALASTWDD